MSIKEAIAELAEKKDLNEKLAKAAFTEIMAGKATEAQIAAFITALRLKGETSGEIAAGVKVMEGFMKTIKPKVEGKLLDTCGTGGDKLNTFNISTTAMFAAAGAGCFIAKHGNRSVSSQSGSADVLEALGINISLQPEETEKVIEQTGLGFLFAPLHHSAMKHAIKPRREIGIRTVFNILGPIVNPAKAETRLLGVFNQGTARKVASALQKLEIERALVVHGLDGLDELSTLGESLVFEVNGSKIEERTLTPEEFGLAETKAEELRGGNAQENALILKKILEGEKGARRDIILFNAGAAIYANKKAKSIKEGMEMAANAIDSGKALEKLKLIKKATNK